jgi:hypothetical protein
MIPPSANPIPRYQVYLVKRGIMRLLIRTTIPKQNLATQSQKSSDVESRNGLDSEWVSFAPQNWRYKGSSTSLCRVRGVGGCPDCRVNLS